ncbi:MAG: twin arginine-targeting protein translocase TatB [Sphingomonas sp. 28-66-16]|nr:MAG: twin arginine-targeting protein translocase TatB [Sphingomonas sp. 28-66-16]
MFDIAPSELLLVALVALVVIGPKDLPKAMRVVGYWVGRGRGVMRQFRSGFDSMLREAELKEMEERWAAENERIMRDHPPTPAMLPAAPMVSADDEPAPAMVEMPAIIAPLAETATPAEISAANDGATETAIDATPAKPVSQAGSTQS